MKFDILKPLPCRFDVPSDCSVELSPSGHQFFTELFEIFDKVVAFSFALAFIVISGNEK